VCAQEGRGGENSLDEDGLLHTELPDLVNGYVTVAAFNPANNWTTPIEAVLIKHGAQTSVAYLTHECRAESVSAEGIFREENVHEFCVVVGWEGESICLRSGLRLSGSRYFDLLGRTKAVFRNDVVVGESPVEVLSYDDALDLMRNPERRGVSRNLFLKVDFSHGQECYELLAPARYINFPNKQLEASYLQPISGYVLFEDAGELKLAYVACYMTRHGTRVEFVTRKHESLGKIKPRKTVGRYIYQCLHGIGGLCGLRSVFEGEEFVNISRVEGSCSLFRYVA